MGVKYFGQFLVERSVVDAAALNEALALQARRNRDLGVICAALGFLSQKDADRLNARQRLVDKRLGELALEEKLMTEAQLEQALLTQKRDHLPLGAALIELNKIDRATLERALSDFHLDQAPFAVDRIEVPSSVPAADAASAYLDLLRTLLFRVARVQGKLAKPCVVEPGDIRGEVIASQRLTGITSFTAYLSFSNRGARELMSALLGFEPNQPTRDDDRDAVKGFLHLLSTHVTARLTERRQTVEESIAHTTAPHANGKVILVCVCTTAANDEIVLTLAF